MGRFPTTEVVRIPDHIFHGGVLVEDGHPGLGTGIGTLVENALNFIVHKDP